MIVSRAFGVAAGLLAALALAVMPVSVATDRNNTIDGLLVLVILLAALAVMRSVETGRLRWLISSFALIGLGFEIKMLQAYLVMPAVALVYLVAAPHTWTRRLGHLAAATVVLLAISLAWPLAVDLTPADRRPYVGGSQNNSVLELITGHNGLARIGGFARGCSVAPPGPAPYSPATHHGEVSALHHRAVSDQVRPGQARASSCRSAEDRGLAASPASPVRSGSSPSSSQGRSAGCCRSRSSGCWSSRCGRDGARDPTGAARRWCSSAPGS